MTSEKKKCSEKLFILDLFDIMFEAEIQSEEDVDRYFENLNINSQVMVQEGLTMIRKFKGELRRSKSKKLKTLFEQLIEKMKTLKTTDEKRRVISNTLAPENEQLALIYYRRLEKIADADIESLEDEVKLLNLWKEIFPDEKEES